MTSIPTSIHTHTGHPGAVKAVILGEKVDIFPLHCMRRYDCRACVLEGKLRCHPRFWDEGIEQLPPLVERYCINCGKAFTITRNRLRRGRGRLCSTRCVAKVKLRFGILHGRTREGCIVVCEVCGRLVYREKSDIERSSRFFCNSSHKSKWLGSHSGFGNPEHPIRRMYAARHT